MCIQDFLLQPDDALYENFDENINGHAMVDQITFFLISYAEIKSLFAYS
jgi:hypothetical protein